MKISDSIRSAKLESADKVQEKAYAKKAEEQAVSNSGSDTISISPLAKQFSQAATQMAELQEEHSQKITDIKSKVENGSYLDSVSKDQVAGSLLDYVRDENLG